MMPEFDIRGQQALCGSRVFVLGVGGLGSAVVQYLAAAGVGTLVLADFDHVELSNLQRQVVHGQSSLGHNKAESAARAVANLNPEVRVEVITSVLNQDNLEQYLKHVDLVVDCSDTFTTRFAVNRACFSLGVPLVSGAAIRMEGQLSVFDPSNPSSPCYQCLFDPSHDQNLSCSESGILSPVVGVIGCHQALEAVKQLSGVGRSLVGRVLIFDAKQSSWREFALSKDPQCGVCRSPSVKTSN